MQQPPHLVYPHGTGGSAGHHPAAPASVPPSTPRKKGEVLNQLIRSLENQYHLGFRVSTELRSPVHSKSAADLVANRIQHLFYSHKPALDEVLATFATTATFIPKEQQLDALSSIIRSKVQHESPTSRTGTPLSGRNVPRGSLKTPQPSMEDTPRSRGLFDNYGHDTPASLRAAVSDPGSPTDEDEDDFVTPPSPRVPSRSPSPSVTSMSAQRRVEASALPSLHSTARKRPSDGLSQDGKSLKLTKTSKGKQPFNKPQIPASVKSSPAMFRKPSLSMARSINAPSASQSTVNTSFNTISSSQQTQPDTANTSFTSDADHTEVPHSFVTRKDFTTTGSLDDYDLFSVAAKIADEAATLEKPGPSNSSSQDCDSSSTWGSSLPEEDLLDASARVESMHALSPVGLRRLSPQRSAQRFGGSQPACSPLKTGDFDHSASVAASLNQSFPPPPGIFVRSSTDKPEQRSRSSSNMSPARATRRSSREQTPAESPSKIAYHILDIPRKGLFVDEPPANLRAMPYFALFICQRVALERSVSLKELVGGMDLASACADPDTFWTHLLGHPKIAHIRSRDSDRVWSAVKRRYEGFTFKGQINLRSKRSGPIFNLDLHPILPDKSCRFQRKFGADRFLYLKVPELDVKNWIGGTQEDLEYIRERWHEWIHIEHAFLFRKWRVFHIEPMKKAKTKGQHAEMTHNFRIVLFATEGCGIDRKHTVGQMLDWFLPFAQNLGQSFCKAYARFDLGLSRTTPTLVFKPSQIIRVGDTFSNGDQEATEFDDPRLKWDRIPSRQVMNDGCSIMSVGAAREIWRLYKKASGVSGPLPSAFQGRIGGAKGLWMISDESFTKDPEHLAIWIRISASQLKFEPHPEDFSDATFDPLRLTFEVSNYSSTPTHSDLHISFIPIMADRGVPREVIAEYMKERLDASRLELVEKMVDPVRLYEYVHTNGSTFRDGSEMSWQAALPLALEEKIKLLLESGFLPCRLQVLAKSVLRLVKRQHLLQESKLKTPLGKATYLYGVADPLGVLKPGEVHIQFSSSFVDEVTDEKYLSLRGHNLLVARQPALRRSDMQKVRAVVCPELSHLVDLVVFPSTGQFPLAGKLQGGDYDGDIFWLCWEERLVTTFQNAPAPVGTPDPEQYGIKVNRDKLEDIQVDVNDDSSIDDFLQRAIALAIAFRSVRLLLGRVTVSFETASYWTNCLSSRKLDHLANIHDLLVDAPKQGYIYTEPAFQRFLRGRLNYKQKLKQPDYKRAMDACAPVKESDGVDKTREEQYECKQDHIIDYLYFKVVRSHNVETLKQIQQILSSATEADADLLYPCQSLKALGDPVIDEDVRKAQEMMGQLHTSWNANTHIDDKYKRGNDFAKVVEDLYIRFQAIKPIQIDHPSIQPLLQPYLKPDSCLWDRLRASILYSKFPYDAAQTFVFQMAGDELAKIKAERYPHTRYIIAEIRANMKPRPIRAQVPDDEVDDDDDLASVLEQQIS